MSDGEMNLDCKRRNVEDYGEARRWNEQDA